ncbi:nucleoside/nucleotide kinase family protein [Nioella nitratireducens]|uniref:hypothetical protein n=1 Tax=Nioella nitratireducens TaxID=1287720 RepID=UPI0008FD67E7|nr:hypothetical protein [Nioella nitratireducens]
MPSQPEDIAQTTLPRLLSLGGERKIIAVAGPPGSGKSTISAALCDALTGAGRSAAVVPMDGFHLDNRLLGPRGLQSRKGSPDSFDADGFVQLIRRIGSGRDVIYPLFDRDRDIAIAGAGHLPPEVEFVLVEGNYLLLDRAPWSGLSPLWSFTLKVDTPLDRLKGRLRDRWVEQGLSESDACARRDANDLPNAELVLSNSRDADLTISN